MCSVELTGFFYKDASYKEVDNSQAELESQILLSADGVITDLSSEANPVFTRGAAISVYLPPVAEFISRAKNAGEIKTQESVRAQNSETVLSPTTPSHRRIVQQPGSAVCLEEWFSMPLAESSLSHTLGIQAPTFSIPLPKLSIRLRVHLSLLFVKQEGLAGYKLRVRWPGTHVQGRSEVKAARLEDFLVQGLVESDKIKRGKTMDEEMSNWSPSPRTPKIGSKKDAKNMKQVLRRNEVAPAKKYLVRDSAESLALIDD